MNRSQAQSAATYAAVRCGSDRWVNVALDVRGGEIPRALLARMGRHWPDWIDFCLDCSKDVTGLHIDDLLEVLPQALAKPGMKPETREWIATIANFAAEIGGRREAAAKGTTQMLLMSAMKAAAEGRGLVARELSSPGSERISLPVLLIDGSQETPTGRVGDLTLWRVRWSGLHEHEVDKKAVFFPAPASVLLDLDEDFSFALDAAAQLLGTQAGESLKGCFLAWDVSLRPVSEQPNWLHRLSGPSAGAAFALAGMGLLNEGLLPGLKASLKAVDWPSAAVTAAIDALGKLSPVGELENKIGALLLQDHPFPRLARVFVANGQKVVHPTAQHVPRVDCADIHDLISKVAGETAPTTLYGEYPDVVAALHGGSTAGRDAYRGFVGRKWLTKTIQRTIDELSGGGIVVLEAPKGFGKTAWALRQVELNVASASPLQEAVGQHIALDGWAFALPNRATAMASPTDDPDVLIKQLSACVRHRLASQPKPDYSPTLPNLLADCGRLAATLKRRVILLIDGVDEAFDRTDLGIAAEKYLGQDTWPKDVVLLLTGTSKNVGMHRLVHHESRPVKHVVIRLTADAPAEAAEGAGSINDIEQDFREYVRMRVDEIVRAHPMHDVQLHDALVKHSNRQFSKLRDLLRDRSSLVRDLELWHVDPQRICLGATPVNEGMDALSKSKQESRPSNEWRRSVAIAGVSAALVALTVVVTRAIDPGSIEPKPLNSPAAASEASRPMQAISASSSTRTTSTPGIAGIHETRNQRHTPPEASAGRPPLPTRDTIAPAPPSREVAKDEGTRLLIGKYPSVNISVVDLHLDRGRQFGDIYNLPGAIFIKDQNGTQEFWKNTSISYRYLGGEWKAESSEDTP